MDVARELIAVARDLVAIDFDSPGLNGMKNIEARKFVNNLLHRHTKGFFRDEYWKPVQQTWDELEKHNVVAVVTSAEYDKDERGNPSSKTWKFEIRFVNDKGRDTTLHGVMVASGAGTVADPLSRYDLVAYAN